MDNRSSWSSTTFELEDIEIINHQTENEEKLVKWQCDQCSLYFLEKSKLDEHKKKHPVQEIVKCKYCQKTISSSSGNRECYINRKCETCEYKCSKCPQRFLRHSSLMNHEKKHSSPKRKRSINNNKKINGTNEETIGVSKGLKKKQLEAEDSEKQFTELKIKNGAKMKTASKRKTNLEVKATSDGGESTPINVPRRLSMKARKSAETKNNCEPAKAAKRLSMKTNKLPEDKHSDIKSKQNPIVSSQTISPTTNASSSENVVNYKPFSCHVCGDTFASDGALLDHIRTHGENAAKSFKCKFCGDEFDDIYKMQYHLAICPLAEDELESSLKQVIPANIPLKYSGGTSTPRKRGRPKKIVELPLEPEDLKNESTPSPVKRGKFRKRKSDVVEQSNGTEENSFELPLPKQSKKSLNKEPLTQPDSNRVAKDNELDTVSGDIVEVTKESDLDEERKKIHQCPFPRCDFKFTREKALLCHMRNHSDDFDDSLKCHKCDIPFDDIHTLRLHINTCKGIKEERDEDFNRAGSYDPSPNRTFQRTKRDFVCNQCGKSYQSQEKLNRCTHVDLVDEDFLVCRLCGVETEDENSLKKHFNSTHPKSFPYQCRICKAEFESTSAEHDHRMTHAKNEEQFTCVICSAKFPTYKHLYFHYSKDHVEQSENICKICNITFPSNMALEEHNYMKHKSDDRFKCIFCHKVYRSSVYLTVHMKTHSTKIYKCKICYRPFTDMASLFQHMLFHASTLGTERPLKCAICLAAYAKQSALKYHISKHVTKHSFSCLICGETWTDHESMSDHIFDHSIRITENKMTENETEWVDKLKERKTVMKQGRPRNSLNNGPCFEEDDPDFIPNTDIKSINIESEETPPLRRGRGRPRKLIMKETPQTKLGRGKKLSGDPDTTVEKTPTTKIGDGIVQKYHENHNNTRRSRRLVDGNIVGDFKAQREIKGGENEETLLKLPHQNEKIVYECPVTTKEKDKGKKKRSEDENPTAETDSQASQSRRKSGIRPNHHHSPSIKGAGVITNSETKVRPMSFKIFSSLTNTRALKVVNKKLQNRKNRKLQLAKEEVPDEELVDLDLLDETEEMFDDEEDPLGGIEIPYASEEKDMESTSRFVNGNRDLDCPDNVFNGKTSHQEESNRLNDTESRNSNCFIKEKKYFEPSRGLTKYSCTTCFMSFPSQDELMFHNTSHIL